MLLFIFVKISISLLIVLIFTHVILESFKKGLFSMPKHTEIKTLPYPKEFIYGIVRDVASYPKFLPWCGGADILESNEDGFIADLHVGYGPFKESFRSKVTTTQDAIVVDCIKGPFTHLETSWGFEEVSESETKVTYSVDFGFESVVFQTLMSTFFEQAFNRMVAAFEEQARRTYRP